ncbi:hypothetical protein J2X85_001638 [Microbacterium trichothecenolyticum]|uniref:hypothetical protein n=1 Tax=Microbacterium trichothecenolyticum TaxID=69370 RepID=UPI00285677C2|nr:hypothetical protein [Microbacterium trichothecenolyticum]MDR7184615.1 hypothetical protein [Microbacterium trichothecenolyticum]
MNAEIERPSLADAFKGTGENRAAGLAGLLPTVAPPPSTDAKAAKTREVAAAPIVERPAREKRAPKPPSSQPEHVGVDNVAAYLPPDVLALVRAEKARRVDPSGHQPTYDELLVEALATVTVDELRAAFTAARVAGGGLIPKRSRAPRGTGTIQVQIRLDGTQRVALEELRETVEAPSRSALISTALATYLGRTRGSEHV